MRSGLRWPEGGSLLLGVAVVASVGAQAWGLGLPLLEPDEALYALLSRELAGSGQWWSLTLLGETWLDKPHLPFWCAAASFRLLGASPFAYRLPGFLALLVGTAYAGAFGRRFLGPGVAGWAVVATLTAFHLVLSSHDVRAEPYLLATVLAALYHLAAAEASGGAAHALAAGLAAGLAVISKGTFAVLPTLGAGGLAALAARRRPTAAQLLALGLGLLLPVAAEAASLQAQFGAEPQGGWRAFAALFWEGQWGRFNPRGAPTAIAEAGPTYYLHTLAWAFAPWYPALLVAAWRGGRALWRTRARVMAETPFPRLLLAASASLALGVFSLSRFQLPYYLNFELPVFALLVAEVAVLPEGAPGQRVAARLQAALAVALLLAAALLLLFAEVPGRWPALAVLALPAAALASPRARAWRFSAAAGAAVAVVSTLVFAPWLLHYEAGAVAGAAAARQPAPRFSVGWGSYAYLFHAGPATRVLDREHPGEWRVPPGSLVYVTAEDLPLLDQAGLRAQVVERFRGTAVSRPRAPFLDPSRRAGVLAESLLVKVTP